MLQFPFFRQHAEWLIVLGVLLLLCAFASLGCAEPASESRIVFFPTPAYTTVLECTRGVIVTTSATTFGPLGLMEVDLVSLGQDGECPDEPSFQDEMEYVLDLMGGESPG